MILRALSVLLILSLWPTGAARAHEIRPAIVDLSFDGQGQVRTTILLNLEAVIAGIPPQHSDTDESDRAGIYNGLRALPPDALRARFDEITDAMLADVRFAADGARLPPRVATLDIAPVGDEALARETTLTLVADLPPGAQTVTWGWDERLGPAIVRARERAEAPVTYTAYLKDGAATEPIPASGAPSQAWSEVAWNYLVIGFTHILPKGLDHILFVIGLFLLSPKIRPLAWQISAFTLAHTMTLALGILGLVRISPAIVEPLIAASIVYVAVENVLSSTLHRWRPVVVFCFGLLHGLGFAGVLAEVGLQRDQFLTGLIAFNVGVELGQLTVVGLCFLAVGLWFRHRAFYRAAITVPASLAIALIGAWWFVERVGLV